MADRDVASERGLSRKEMTRRVGEYLAVLRRDNARAVATLRQAGRFDYVNSNGAIGGKFALERELVGPALIYRAYSRWQVTSTVYNFHPDMITALGETQHKKVPALTLDVVPHVNPMLCFPQPQMCVDANGDPAELIATYVTGMDTTTRTLCDTNDDRRTGLRMVVVTRNVARPESLEHATFKLGTRTGWLDFDAEVAKAAQRQAHLDPDGQTVEQHATASSLKLQLALRALMYVTSKGMDHAPAPEPRKTSRKVSRKAGPVQPRIYDVGFTEGPDLAAALRQYERSASGTGTGGSVRPHPRRSTYAIRWTGPGGLVPESRFVRATYIHRPKAGEVTTPTIIAVRDQSAR
jgi:hypothetical protein